MSPKPTMPKRGPKGWWNTPDKISALRAAFQNDATIGEACKHAGIWPSEYYEYKKRNPEFVTDIENESFVLRLAAKGNIARAIINDKDLATSWKFLEKRDPSYAPPSKIHIESNHQFASIADLITQVDDEKAAAANDPLVVESSKVGTTSLPDFDKTDSPELTKDEQPYDPLNKPIFPLPTE